MYFLSAKLRALRGLVFALPRFNGVGRTKGGFEGFGNQGNEYVTP